jgi:hypothetical protein
MKRFLMLMVMLTVAFFAQVGVAADVNVNTTFGWTQDNAAVVASTDVFRGSSATGPWTLLKNQPMYTLVPPAVEYQTTAAVAVPEGAQTTVWFKAQNIGTVAQGSLRSADSTIISKTYDTRVAPAAPGSFNVK